MKKLLLIPTLTIALAGGTAHAQLVDFNTAGDLNTYFNATGTRTDKYTETAGNGLGSSRGLEVITSGSQGNRISKTAINGESLTEVSMYFQFDPVATESLTGTGFFIGFGASATYDPSLADTVPDGDHFLVGINGPDAGALERRLINQPKTAGTTSNQVSANFTLTAGNWYQLKLEVTNFDVNGYDITSSLWNSDANGTIGTMVDSLNTVDFDNTDLSGGNVYAFFGGQGAADHRVGLNYDNFTAVPEPTTFAMLLGGLGALTLLRRHRRL